MTSNRSALAHAAGVSFVALASIGGACQGAGAHGPTTNAATSASASTATATAASSAASSAASLGAASSAEPEPKAPTMRAETGPFEAPFLGARNVYWVAPRKPGKQRLLAMLHGVCNPPAYTCGLWAESAKDLGFLVCPTGNSKCGKEMYEAPTWTQSDAKIGADLELAIGAVEDRYPGELDRDGAVLLGFSKGAYAAVNIAVATPNRWRYLVLVEADAKPTAKQLRAAGVRAVAFVAGDLGAMIGGEKKTVAALEKQGFPARFFAMENAGHYYSSDAHAVLAEAVRWTTSHE